MYLHVRYSNDHTSELIFIFALHFPISVFPKIVDSSTLVVVHKGRTAAMHCIAEGRPYPQLSMLRGDQELEQHSHYRYSIHVNNQQTAPECMSSNSLVSRTKKDR